MFGMNVTADINMTIEVCGSETVETNYSMHREIVFDKLIGNQTIDTTNLTSYFSKNGTCPFSFSQL